jgi:hypothetical protein
MRTLQAYLLLQPPTLIGEAYDAHKDISFYMHELGGQK